MKQPLALRMRPKTIDDVIGQKHLVGKDMILRKVVEQKQLFSFIFFGPSGTGKTTLAKAIANSLNRPYRLFNAVTGNKKELDAIFLEAKMNNGLVLIVDEIHRLNKDKQDLLLPYLEEGLIYLMGTTTSNPYFAINPAIRSRCHLLEVKALTTDDIKAAINNAIKAPEGLNNEVTIADDALQVIANHANGDIRYALNVLEICAIANKHITMDVVLEYSRLANSSISKDDDGYKYKIDVQGPAGIANAGIFDSGTNSIENIAKTLSNQVQQILNMNPANTITVRVRGHSRGGVALSFFLREISKQYKPKVSVDYSIQYDPVPGQTISIENMDYSKIGSSKYYRYDVDRRLVKKSIVVYSLYTQYGYERFGTTENSFVPQAVFGTDIIIIECKNHSVGLDKGKEFIDTQLDRGVYIRRHYQLEKVNSYEEFKHHRAILEYPFNQANKNNPKNEEIEKRVNYQQKRYNVIYDVVKAWFKKKN